MFSVRAAPVANLAVELGAGEAFLQQIGGHTHGRHAIDRCSFFAA